MSIRVFISYSSIDEELASEIGKVLEQSKIEYFLDKKDIEWGDDVTETISEGLGGCSAIIVVISPASIKSQWVPYEIGYAVASGLRVLPYKTHPSLEIPGYMQRYHFETELDKIEEYFSKLIESSTEVPAAIEIHGESKALAARYLRACEAAAGSATEQDKNHPAWVDHTSCVEMGKYSDEKGLQVLYLRWDTTVGPAVSGERVTRWVPRYFWYLAIPNLDDPAVTFAVYEDLPRVLNRPGDRKFVAGNNIPQWVRNEMPADGLIGISFSEIKTMV